MYVSKIIRVMMEESGIDFTIQQIPVPSRLQIKLQTNGAQKLSVSIKDARGTVMVQQSFFAGEGVSNYSLPVQKLPGGVYYITVSQAGSAKTKTFVKL